MALLEADGLDGLSLRAIAARVGVSHTAPKNHFGSLKGLVTAIGAEGFRLFAAEMRAGVSETSGRRERLNAAMEGYVRFAQQHPALFKIMFSNDYCDYFDEDLREAAQSSYGILRQISEGLDWEHADAPDGQWRTEIMLWSMVHGYATLANEGQLGDGTDAARPGVLDVMPSFSYRDS